MINSLITSLSKGYNSIKTRLQELFNKRNEYNDYFQQKIHDLKELFDNRLTPLFNFTLNFIKETYIPLILTAAVAFTLNLAITFTPLVFLPAVMTQAMASITSAFTFAYSYSLVRLENDTQNKFHFDEDAVVQTPEQNTIAGLTYFALGMAYYFFPTTTFLLNGTRNLIHNKEYNQEWEEWKEWAIEEEQKLTAELSGHAESAMIFASERYKKLPSFQELLEAVMPSTKKHVDRPGLS